MGTPLVRACALRLQICLGLSCAFWLGAGCTGAIGEGQPSGRSDRGKSGGGGPAGSGSGGPGVTPGSTSDTCSLDGLAISPLRRLTRIEYDNSVRALLGQDVDVSRGFSPDERAGAFPGNYHTPISEMQFTQYASAASALAAQALDDLSTLLPCDPAADEAGCAESFIRDFGARAFRRPLEDAEVASYRQLFELGKNGDGTIAGAGFENGIKVVIEALLQSPHFLYLIEGPGPLTQHQLAARLSYFLWKSPPDATLATAADEGRLASGETLVAEARRLLNDERALSVLADFHTHWLSLESVVDLEKSEEIYPGFEEVKGALTEETRRFVGDVLTQGDGRLDTLLTASFTYANGPLRALYGVQGGGDGVGWQRIELDPAQRSGLLTQASFLASHGEEGAAPIHRAAAIREQFLCAELPPPPPGADQNLPPPAPTTTTRERLDRHRQDPSCGACHRLLDPLGFAFEAYDGIGRYRQTEGGKPVDDSGELIGTDVDGPFVGARELNEKLLGSRDVHRCLVLQWFRYAFGRLEEKADTCVLDALVDRFAETNHDISDLVLAIVESTAFRTHRGEEMP